jgi:hypothetical protein
VVAEWRSKVSGDSGSQVEMKVIWGALLEAEILRRRGEIYKVGVSKIKESKSRRERMFTKRCADARILRE